MEEEEPEFELLENPARVLPSQVCADVLFWLKELTPASFVPDETGAGDTRLPKSFRKLIRRVTKLIRGVNGGLTRLNVRNS